MSTSIKPRCEHCGFIGNIFECLLCYGEFCEAHRIPEDHDCDGLESDDMNEKDDEDEGW